MRGDHGNPQIRVPPGHGRGVSGHQDVTAAESHPGREEDDVRRSSGEGIHDLPPDPCATSQSPSGSRPHQPDVTGAQRFGQRDPRLDLVQRTSLGPQQLIQHRRLELLALFVGQHGHAAFGQPVIEVVLNQCAFGVSGQIGMDRPVVAEVQKSQRVFLCAGEQRPSTRRPAGLQVVSRRFGVRTPQHVQVQGPVVSHVEAFGRHGLELRGAEPTATPLGPADPAEVVHHLGIRKISDLGVEEAVVRGPHEGTGKVREPSSRGAQRRRDDHVSRMVAEEPSQERRRPPRPADRSRPRLVDDGWPHERRRSAAGFGG